MRSPSARVLINRVDAYAATSGQDRDGGYRPSYPAIPTLAGLPCTVQGQGPGEEVDSSGRITPVNMYMVMFGADPGLTSRDKLIQTDVSPNRVLFVQGNSPSEAGRGSAFALRTIERL